MNDLDTFSRFGGKEGASDLHISEERNPYLRVSGTLVPLTKYPKFTKTLMQNILESVLSDSKKVFSKLLRALILLMITKEKDSGLTPFWTSRKYVWFFAIFSKKFPLWLNWICLNIWKILPD